jgi:alcohol dehydrogenase
MTAPFVNACGRCRQCLAGEHQVCGNQSQPGFTHPGSFADLVVVEHADVNLVEVPDGVHAVSAAALGCRFATAFRAVLQVGHLTAGEWTAVHGCGGVGLGAVQVAAAAGGRVVAVDVRQDALDLAVATGAEVGVRTDPREPPLDVAARVRAAAGGPIDLSLDALGSPATCAASIGCLAPRGRHVQVGLLPEVLGWPALPMHLVVAGELRLLGSHGMAARRYPALLGLVAAGRLRPGDLVTSQVALDGVGAALVSMGDFARSGTTVAVP